MSFSSHRKFILAMLAACLLAGALPARDIPLPTARKTGGMPLMEALAKRATQREFDTRELPPEQLSSLLWACFGINRPDGKRTAPSAHNQQASEIFVLLKSGAYLYDAAAEKLQLKAAEDIRHLASTQDYTSNAPVTLVFAADLSKMGRETGAARLAMASLNTGYISQNVYLYCASAGLATGARASFDRPALMAKLGLGSNHEIILAHSVGWPQPAKRD